MLSVQDPFLIGGGRTMMPRSGMVNTSMGPPPVGVQPSSAPVEVSPIRPYSDPTLTFDFEPAVEKMIVSKPVVRVADPKYKTIVCVHWYNGLCMKGDNCEFLHEMDIDRMPECRQGERCTDKLCPFKHLKAEERPICNNYNLGFCQHGSSCRFQHRKRPPQELALECDYAHLHPGANRERNEQQLGQQSSSTTNPQDKSQLGIGLDGLVAPIPGLSRQQNIRRQLNYRTAMCNSFSTTGACTYGDNCDYAHSEEERQRNISLRNQATSQARIPLAAVMQPSLQTSSNQPPVKRVLASPLDGLVLNLREWTEDDQIDPLYMNPLALPPPAGERLPDSGEEAPRYFVLRSANFEYLARSVMSDRWYVLGSLAVIFNAAYESNSAVFFFFAVDGEEGCFGGVAKMTSLFQRVQNTDDISRCETPSFEAPEYGECSLEWLRVNELSYKKTAYLMSVDPLVQRELPVAMAIEGQELPPSVGHSLMTMCYRERPIELDGDKLEAHKALAIHPPGPSPEVDVAFRESPPDPSQAVATPQVKSDSFIVQVTTHPLFMEAMSRQLFGLQLTDATAALDVIRPGTMVLCYTSYDGRLHGVFEAISGLERNWEPSAFADASNKTTLPMQFRFRVVLPCAPMHENALVMNFHQRTGVYRPEEMQPLVNLFATKTRQGEMRPALRSPALEAIERGLPPPLVVPKGISIGPVQENPPGVFKQSMMVNIEFDPRFKAPNRLIGKSGMNMTMVKEKSGVTRARVYAGDEAPAEGVMEMVYEAASKESLDEAIRISKELLDDLMKQYEEFKERGVMLRMQRQGINPDQMPPPQMNVPPGMPMPPPDMAPPPPMTGGPPRGMPPFKGPPPPRGQFYPPPRGPPMDNMPPQGDFAPPHEEQPPFPPPPSFSGPPPRGAPPQPNRPPRRESQNNESASVTSSSAPQPSDKARRRSRGRKRSASAGRGRRDGGSSRDHGSKKRERSPPRSRDDKRYRRS